MSTLRKAQFEPARGQAVPVDFNPESIQYDVTNALEPDENAAQPNPRAPAPAQQFVTQTTARLSLELVFDATDTGVDVRSRSQKILALMKPDAQGRSNQTQTPRGVPQKVTFRWGTFVFTGFIESYQEVVDLFSDQGVPLRSKVNLSMAEEQPTFAAPSAGARNSAIDRLSLGSSPAAAAEKLGQPNAQRPLAEKAGADNVRQPGGTTSPPSTGFGGGSGGVFGAAAGASAGFGASGGGSFGATAGASANAGFSASANAGFSASANAGFGASAGASANASFGASANASFGASANASFGASAGASARASFGTSASASTSFSGLRTVTAAPLALPDPAALLEQLGKGPVVGVGVGFSAGGRVTDSGSSFAAPVARRLRFDTEGR